MEEAYCEKIVDGVLLQVCCQEVRTITHVHKEK
jgi:hypothetical protein